MEKWEEVSSRDEFENLVFLKGPVPKDDEEFRIEMLGKCKENLCGCYNTNWGCPPGACNDPKGLYSRTSFVLVAKRIYELDVEDKSLTEKATREMQDNCRYFLISLMKEGVKCTAFTDGPCKYCGVCAYPNPCRYPEMRMASASSLGLDIGKYLEKLGEKFEFNHDRMTLYALFFIQ